MNHKSTPKKQEPMKTPPNQNAADVAKAAKRSLNKGKLIVVVLMVLSLTWYLMADRYTPLTSQARVQGYVIGVAPKVSGLVTDIWVLNNTEVQQGQQLFQMDPSPYEIAVAKAVADLDNARNQVAAGDAAEAEARADLNVALANEDKAKKEATRMQSLYKKDDGTISLRRLEAAEASLEVASASVVKAEAAIQRAIQSKGGSDNAHNALLKAAESAVENAKLDLSNTVVRASINGLITDLRAEVGQYAGTGTPVLTLLSLRDVWVEAQFTENNLGHMQEGSKVEILFDSVPGKVFKGVVRNIGLGVSDGAIPQPGHLPEISNNRDWLRQSQRFPVIISFDSEQSDLLAAQVRIGGQASVIGYTEQHRLLNALGKLYIRLCSLFTYLY